MTDAGTTEYASCKSWWGHSITASESFSGSFAGHRPGKSPTASAVRVVPGHDPLAWVITLRKENPVGAHTAAMPCLDPLKPPCDPARVTDSSHRSRFFRRP